MRDLTEKEMSLIAILESVGDKFMELVVDDDIAEGNMDDDVAPKHKNHINQFLAFTNGAQSMIAQRPARDFMQQYGAKVKINVGFTGLDSDDEFNSEVSVPKVPTDVAEAFIEGLVGEVGESDVECNCLICQLIRELSERDRTEGL